MRVITAVLAFTRRRKREEERRREREREKKKKRDGIRSDGV